MRSTSLAPLGLCAFVLAPTFALGCESAAPGTGRSPWIAETLLADNRDLAERDPQRLAGKFARMALTPFAFFRGTLALHVRDATGHGIGYEPTAFDDADASQVLLVGDPHPENFGSFLSGWSPEQGVGRSGQLVVGFNDFDAASYGPFVFDLRRLAVGFVVAAATCELPESNRLRDALAEAIPAAYADQIESLATREIDAPTDSTFDPSRDSAEVDAVVRAMVDDATVGGRSRSELESYTVVDESTRPATRRMRLGVTRDPLRVRFRADESVEVELRELVGVTMRERGAIDAAMQALHGSLVDPVAFTPAMLRVKDVARRLGQGTASYALLRYYVLVEGPTAAIDDDWIVELKETRDVPKAPDLELEPEPRWSSNGERVVRLSREAIGSSFDMISGWGNLGGLGFKARHVTGYQAGVDVRAYREAPTETSRGREDQDALCPRLADGRLTESDFVAYGKTTARALARVHALAPAASGRRALPGLVGVLRGRRDQLVSETARFARSYGDQTLADYTYFLSLLGARGPLLGYVALGPQVR